MQPETYQQYTDELTRTLAADDRVLSLVALGSMASDTFRDQWSDHDFWVITIPGAQPALLEDLSWLPNHHEIAICLRPAAQYYTVLYRDGHIAEFAVFDLEQLTQGKLDRYRLLFDKQAVGERIRRVAEATATQQGEIDTTFEFGNFLVFLWVGLARYWRGEQMSSHKYLTQYALDTLLSLIVKHVQPEAAGIVDSLDARRRFATAYPALSEELQIWHFADAPALATRLLSIADRELSNLLPDYPQQAVAELRKTIEMNTT